MEERLKALEAQAALNTQILVEAAYNAEEASLLLKTLTMLLVRAGQVKTDEIMMVLRATLAQYPDAKRIVLQHRLDNLEETLRAATQSASLTAH